MDCINKKMWYYLCIPITHNLHTNLLLSFIDARYRFTWLAK